MPLIQPVIQRALASAILNKKQGRGEKGAGSREQGAGSREQGAGRMLLLPCRVAKRNMGSIPHSFEWLAFRWGTIPFCLSRSDFGVRLRRQPCSSASS